MLLRLMFKFGRTKVLANHTKVLIIIILNTIVGSEERKFGLLKFIVYIFCANIHIIVVFARIFFEYKIIVEKI